MGGCGHADINDIIKIMRLLINIALEAVIHVHVYSFACLGDAYACSFRAC